MINLEYKIGDSVLKLIKSSIYESFNGVVEFKGAEPSAEVVITTGLGGAFLLNKELGKDNIITDPTQSEGYFAQFVIPFLAKVHLTVNPSLDNEKDKGPTYYPIDGFRKESYTFTIKDKDLKDIIKIECVGKRPVFEQELLTLIRESKIAEKYEVLPTFLNRYIMNCLKNLE